MPMPPNLLPRAHMFGWQDTYVFTKATGEMVVNGMRGDVPVVTIRPSVIEGTFKEPFAGWIEGNRFDELILVMLRFIGCCQIGGKPVALLAHNGCGFDFCSLAIEFQRHSVEIPDTGCL